MGTGFRFARRVMAAGSDPAYRRGDLAGVWLEATSLLPEAHGFEGLGCQFKRRYQMRIATGLVALISALALPRTVIAPTASAKGYRRDGGTL